MDLKLSYIIFEILNMLRIANTKVQAGCPEQFIKYG